MSGQSSNLIMDLRPGERLAFNGMVSVELIQKSGRVARLRVVAPREVSVKKEGKELDSTSRDVVPSMNK